MTQPKQARDLIAAIKQGQVYSSGAQFSVDQIMRSMHCLKTLGTSRVRQLLNRMVDDGLLDKIALDEGHMAVEYRARSQWRKRLLSPWAKVPADCDHSPRWF